MEAVMHQMERHEVTVLDDRFDIVRPEKPPRVG
jgi:hypothetical protein